MVQDAMRLQAAGTGPHNQLVHMTQGEVDAMNALAGSGIGGLRSNGMAINPQTGLPEAGFFADILPTLVGMGAMFIPTMQPIGAGLLAGGTSLAAQKFSGEGEVDFGRALLAGLGAWGGASIGQMAGGAETLAQSGATAEALGAAGQNMTQAQIAELAAQQAATSLPQGASFATQGWGMDPGILASAAPGSVAPNIASGVGQGVTAGQEGFLSLVDQVGGPEAAFKAMQGSGSSADALTQLSQAAYTEAPSAGTAFEGLGRFDPSLRWGPAELGSFGWQEAALPGGAAAISTAETLGAFDEPEYNWNNKEYPDTYDYQGPYLPRPRTAFAPPTGYQPGIDPAYQYYSYGNKGGYVGGLPTIRAQAGYTGFGGQRPSQPAAAPPPNVTDMLAATGLGAAAQPKGLGFYTTDHRMALRNLAQAQARPQQAAPRQDPLLAAGLAGQRQPTLPGQMPGQQMFARNGGYASDLPTVRMAGEQLSLPLGGGSPWEQAIQAYKAGNPDPLNALIKSMPSAMSGGFSVPVKKKASGGIAGLPTVRMQGSRPPPYEIGQYTKYRGSPMTPWRTALESLDPRQTRLLNAPRSAISTVQKGIDQLPAALRDYKPSENLVRNVPRVASKFAGGPVSVGAMIAAMLAGKKLNQPEARREDEAARAMALQRAAQERVPQVRGRQAGMGFEVPRERRNIPPYGAEMFDPQQALLTYGKAQGGIAGLPTVRMQGRRSRDRGNIYTGADPTVRVNPMINMVDRASDFLDTPVGGGAAVLGGASILPVGLAASTALQLYGTGEERQKTRTAKDSERELRQLMENGIDSEEEANRVRYLEGELRRTGRGLGTSMFVNRIVPSALRAWERKQKGYTFSPDEFPEPTTLQSAPYLSGEEDKYPLLTHVREAERDAASRRPGADIGEVKKQFGGVAGEPVDITATGVMQGATPEAQADLAERGMVMPTPEQPQNAEENAIYNRALLALQGQLENEEAQMAVDEFVEVFGADALAQLEALVNETRDKGGIVKPANGQDTVGMSEMEVRLENQGPDVIPGMIVDPQTGKQTANLRVGEDEYIMPADGLEREAKSAGLPPTAKNGAMVVSEREEQLRQMYG